MPVAADLFSFAHAFHSLTHRTDEKVLLGVIVKITGKKRILLMAAFLFFVKVIILHVSLYLLFFK